MPETPPTVCPELEETERAEDTGVSMFSVVWASELTPYTQEGSHALNEIRPTLPRGKGLENLLA